MFALPETEFQASKKITIRLDQLSRTYHCTYHRRGETPSDINLLYELDHDKWTVDTVEFKDVFERKLNELFAKEQIPFDEQLRYVVSYLDAHFANPVPAPRAKSNHLYQLRTCSLPWLRRLRSARRWYSQDALIAQPTAPTRPMYGNFENDGSTEAFDLKEMHRDRTKTAVSAFETGNEISSAYVASAIHSVSSNAPPISEIWLNVCVQGVNDGPSADGSYTDKERLQKLAEKFVIYFGGTFRCDVGQRYQLEYEGQMWHFVMLKYAFWNQPITETSKVPKTKIIFLIGGTPYCVRG